MVVRGGNGDAVPINAIRYIQSRDLLGHIRLAVCVIQT